LGAGQRRQPRYHLSAQPSGFRKYLNHAIAPLIGRHGDEAQLGRGLADLSHPGAADQPALQQAALISSTNGAGSPVVLRSIVGPFIL
jgi:hypothetical protein